MDAVAPREPARWLRRSRRCFLECDDRPWVDIAALLQGDLTRSIQPVVRVYAPPDAGPIEISADEALVLASCPQRSWVAATEFAAPAAIERLQSLGLITGRPDDPPSGEPVAVGTDFDDWFGPASLYHYASRWEGIVARADLPANADAARAIYEFSAEAFERDASERGPPPTHRHSRGDDVRAVMLPRQPGNSFDQLLARRETHRLFDPGRPLDLAAVARLLFRSFAVLAEAPMGGGQVAQRKHVPSGGGLHPVEAYVLCANVDGLDCGWYHYRCHQHRLAPIVELDRNAARDRILQITAGQSYFGDAALLVLLTLRFPRHHWKYPQHAKAYRVMLLDAGHVGQMFALAATEDGLGAFVTAAINEVDAERELGLDGIEEGVIAALGCGHPAADGAVLRLSAYVEAG